MTPKVFIKTFGCQMNEYDSDKMADVLHAADGYEPTDRRRRGRPDPLQHLLGAREGAGEGVQRPRPRQAPEGQGRADRRRRLRRQPGRRGDHRARAVRRPGVRPADPAPPAGDAERSARASSGRRSTSAFPRSRSSTTCRRPASRARPPSSRSWKAAPSTAATASCPTRAARKSRGRSTTCWSRSPAWPTRACKEVTLLGQNVNAYRGAMGDTRRDRRLRAAARVRRRDPRHRAHPLHDQPSERIHAAPDRRLRAGAASWSSHLHLPVQHGSDRILMAMKRGYTALEYKSTVRKLRAVRPEHRALERLHRRLSRARPTTTSSRR